MFVPHAFLAPGSSFLLEECFDCCFVFFEGFFRCEALDDRDVFLDELAVFRNVAASCSDARVSAVLLGEEAPGLVDAFLEVSAADFLVFAGRAWDDDGGPDWEVEDSFPRREWIVQSDAPELWW